LTTVTRNCKIDLKIFLKLKFILLKVCAIVGGAFTVAGIIDSILFTASELFKKFEAGKLG
jgi:hypothetical protein